MKRNHLFSKSVRVAINFVSNLKHDNSLLTSLWKEFIWFYEIVPTKIEKVGKDVVNAMNYNKLERKVMFYGYRATLLATVHLEANEFTNTDQTKPTFWKVVAVDYATNYDETRIYEDLKWVNLKITEEETILH